jgi:hypothetical protein
MRALAMAAGLLIASLYSGYSQSSMTEAQAIFLYNFTKMVEWPLEDQQGDFVIGVCSSSEVTNQLKNYVKGKTVGKQPIKVIHYLAAQTVGKCHILFVSFGKTDDLNIIKDRIGNSHTLLVSEKTGALNAGSAINFVVKDDKLKFELKLQNASKYMLNLSSSLVQMAYAKY